MVINEKNFINQLKKKNEKALDYAIDQYGSLVKSIVSKHLYSFPNEIEDCIYDVFMSVWQHIDSFESEKNSFTNWISSISRYKAIDYLRKYKRMKEITALDDDFKNYESNEHQPELEIIEKETSDETEKLLACLSKEDRDILLKLYVDEEAVEKISLEYGLKPSSIYSRVSRAKGKINKCKKEDFNEDSL